MPVATLVFTIVFLILLSLLICVLVCIYAFKPKYLENSEPILFFLELDLKQWRIKKSHIMLNTIAPKQNKNFVNYISKRMGEGWINILNFFSILGDDSEARWHKAIEYCIQNKTNSIISQKIELKSPESKKQSTYIFSLKFRYVNENRINIECRSKNKLDNEDVVKKVISKSELFDLKGRFKLFIAFSIPDAKANMFTSFLSQLDDLINNKHVRYFKSSSSIVLVLSKNSYKAIRRWKRIVWLKLRRAISKSCINYFYDGITFVECQDLKSESDFSKIMTRVSFGLIKSKIQKEAISFNLKSIQFNEFEEFKEKIMVINNMIESNGIEYTNHPVYSIKSNKESFNFCFPKIELKEDFWNNYILEINDFENKIRDKFVVDILSKKTMVPRKTLININDYDIEKNFDLIKSTKDFIFIINRIKFKSTTEFIRLLKLLDLVDAKYGLYVEEFDSTTLSIINNIKPSIIVLSEKFNDNFNSSDTRSKIKVSNAINLSENLNINLLFSNINEDIQRDIKQLSKKDKFYINKSISSFF